MLQALIPLGFTHVTLDPRGFRSGRLNEARPKLTETETAAGQARRSRAMPLYASPAAAGVGHAPLTPTGD